MGGKGGGGGGDYTQAVAAAQRDSTKHPGYFLGTNGYILDAQGNVLGTEAEMFPEPPPAAAPAAAAPEAAAPAAAEPAAAAPEEEKAAEPLGPQISAGAAIDQPVGDAMAGSMLKPPNFWGGGNKGTRGKGSLTTTQT